MKKVIIIYDSQHGHTARVAKAMLKGLRSIKNLYAQCIKAGEAIMCLDDICDYDGIIFGSATYMGSASAEFKRFMEESNRMRAQKAWADKLAGGFTNSCSMSGDKMNTLVQIVVFAAQHRMLWVPLNVSNQSVALDKVSAAPDLLNRVGSSLGVATQSEKI